MNRKKILMGGGCLLLAAVCAAFLRASAPVEPVFKGKTVREYVYSCAGSTEGYEAVRHFGTNALPDISRALRVRDTAARRALVWLGRHQKVIKVPVNSAEDIHFAAYFAYKPILELVYERWLPPAVADSCAPEIRALAVQGGIDESNACVDLLHAIEFVKTNVCSHPRAIEDDGFQGPCP
jgi:hypothetical protein